MSLSQVTSSSLASPYKTTTSNSPHSTIFHKQHHRSLPRIISSAQHVQKDYNRPTKYDNFDNSNNDYDDYIEDDEDTYEYRRRKYQHYYVLPVLLLEFTALALTRAVLPSLLLHEYGNHVYIVMGCADFVRGLLAFVACPLFGKVSDILGRRLCLFITVLGTTAPVCSLALFAWETVVVPISSGQLLEAAENPVLEGTTLELDTTSKIDDIDNHNNSGWTFSFESIASQPVTTATTKSPYAITIFVVLLALSGVFTSTFTLVFAYISDTVRVQEERVAAYGLALATFGLSFTIGPMAGGYLAQYNPQYVFLTSFMLTVADLLYIYAVLPESRQLTKQTGKCTTTTTSNNEDVHTNTANSVASFMTANDLSWNPFDSLQLVLLDPFLRQVGKVALLYYTGLWAIISTLSMYAVKQFHLTPNRLGELMSALGFSTMVAEAVLVRIVVPLLGEKTSMKVGLISFALQCIVLGFAYQPWHLFICAAFSMLGNLVYPSLSSLVSGSVEPEMVGEALGAINGIKALTEGIGPLVFGSLMTISEHSILPGWPYLLVAVFIVAAYKETDALPDVEKDDYIHELVRKRQRQQRLKEHRQRRQQQRRKHGLLAGSSTSSPNNDILPNADSNEEEVEELLSEIDESWEDDDELFLNEESKSDSSSQLAITLGSLTK